MRTEKMRRKSLDEMIDKHIVKYYPFIGPLPANS